jgi:hypothetical protein
LLHRREEVLDMPVLSEPVPRSSDNAPHFTAHLLRALCFDASAYSACAAQRWGLVEGAIIVLLGGLARGVGAFPEEGWRGVALGVAAGVAVWLLATLAVWCVGFALNRRAPAFRALLAALGLAAAPFVLLVLVAWSPVAGVAWMVAHGWATVSAILAVREVERVSSARAALICAIALGLGIAFLMIIGFAMGGPIRPPWNRPCLVGSVS